MYVMSEQTILGGLSVVFKIVLQLSLFIALYMEQVICFYSHINSFVVHNKNFDSFTLQTNHVT